MVAKVFILGLKITPNFYPNNTVIYE